MKWRYLILLLVMLLPATPVFAETSAEVTVTATGYICGEPGGLTATYISETNVQLDWVKGVNAANTIIVAKYGVAPTSRSDGYTVYSGNGTTYNDIGVSLDETATYVYYKAWSQNIGGVWELIGSNTAWIGGTGMILIALFLLCGILSFLSLRSRNVLVAIGAAISWLFVLIYTRENPVGGIAVGSTGDQMFLLLCIGMAIALPLISLMQYRRERTITAKGFVMSEGNIAGSEKETKESNPEEEYREMIHRKLHPRQRR